MTREVIEKLPGGIRWQIEDMRKDYKNPAVNHEAARARLAGYVNGLRDAGMITDRERQIIFVYGTV